MESWLLANWHLTTKHLNQWL